MPLSIVHNEDCLAAMRDMPDKAFDLAICDPPYGIGNFIRPDSRGKKVRRSYPLVTWNNQTPLDDYFNELRRVSKNQIIWGANYYNCFDDKGGTIVWDKGNNHPDMSRCEIASNSIKRTVDYFRLFHAGFTDKNRIHPCQKPILLYSWLLKSYAKAGDTILDTHLGSGSSRIAAYQMGFDFTGYELDKDYYEAQGKRFQLAIQQQSLFQ